MSPKQDMRDIQSALRTIRDYHRRQAPQGRWRLDDPVWKLALQGMAVFAVAFVCGLGAGVLYEVLTGG